MLAPPGRLLHSAEWAPSSPAPGNRGSERHSHLGALVIAHQPANTETLGHGLPRAGASQCLLKSPQFWEVGGPEPDRGGCPERRPSMRGLAPACGHGRGTAHASRRGVGMCAGAAGAGSVGRKLLGDRLAAGPPGRAARVRFHLSCSTRLGRSCHLRRCVSSATHPQGPFSSPFRAA